MGSSSRLAKAMEGSSSSKCFSAKAPRLTILRGSGPFTSCISLSISLLDLPGNRMRPVKSS